VRKRGTISKIIKKESFVQEIYETDVNKAPEGAVFVRHHVAVGKVCLLIVRTIASFVGERERMCLGKKEDAEKCRILEMEEKDRR
jgi:hypothetical protein